MPETEEEYFVCTDCGHKQKSEAETRIRCHRCGSSYRPKDAMREPKRPDEEIGTGFATYTRS